MALDRITKKVHPVRIMGFIRIIINIYQTAYAYTLPEHLVSFMDFIVHAKFEVGFFSVFTCL